MGWSSTRDGSSSKSVKDPGELPIHGTKEIVMMQVLEFFRIFIIGNDS